MEIIVKAGEFKPRHKTKHISKAMQKIIDGGDQKSKLLEHFDEEYLNKVVSDLGYTYLELQTAFTLISPPKNYKDPINAVIDSEDYDICAEACSFITGSSLVEVEQLDGDKIRVEADGYYAAIGA